MEFLRQYKGLNKEIYYLAAVRAMACYEMSRDIGRSIGPLIFRLLIENHSYSFTWGIIAGICVLLFLGMIALSRYQKTKRNK